MKIQYHTLFKIEVSQLALQVVILAQAGIQTDLAEKVVTAFAISSEIRPFPK